MNTFAQQIISTLEKSDRCDEIFYIDGQWWQVGQYLELIKKFEAQLLLLSIDKPSVIAIIGRKNIENLALMVAAWRLNYSLMVLPTRASAEFQAQLLASATAFLVEIDSELKIKVKLLGAVRADSLLIGLWLPTSGTTGTPKLVKLTFKGMLNFANWVQVILPRGVGCKVLSYAPLNFDLSLLEIWSPLIAGGKVIIVDESKMTSATYLHTLINQQKVNVLQGVSGLYRTLLQDSASSLSSIDLAIVTGEKFPVSLVQQVAGLLPGSQLMNIYGCTETNDSFAASLDRSLLMGMTSLPTGLALPGVEFTIDFPHEEDKGELLVHTPFMSAGYSDEQKTAEKFFTDENGRSWFRSGDLASLDENGELQLHGRIDHQIKVDGVRVNLADIEMVLLRHPQVHAVAVWTQINEHGENKIIAAINTLDSLKLSSLTLRKYCAKYMPMAAIPKQLWVTHEEFPVGNNGKYDKGKLSLLYGG